jgi:hypothetical protein
LSCEAEFHGIAFTPQPETGLVQEAMAGVQNLISLAHSFRQREISLSVDEEPVAAGQEVEHVSASQPSAQRHLIQGMVENINDDFYVFHSTVRGWHVLHIHSAPTTPYGTGRREPHKVCRGRSQAHKDSPAMIPKPSEAKSGRWQAQSLVLEMGWAQLT